MLKLPRSQRALSRITLIVASVVGMLLTTGTASMAAAVDIQPPASQRSSDDQSKAKVVASTPNGATGESYAERETAAKDLEQFSGGSAGIYIGGSTVAIVLLIVLVILIL